MPLPVLMVLALLPQLVDRTQEPLKPPPPQQTLSTEKRADIFMARKMYREAVDAYRLALASEPATARVYNKAGIAYHQLRMFPQARKHYSSAVKIDKDYSHAINNLGTVFYAQRRYKKASQTYRKALKISPYSASIYSNLGTALFARKKYKQATQAYLEALRLDPDVFETRHSTGTLLQDRSVRERAKYYYFLATTYARVEMWERAMLYLRKALEEGFRGRKKILKEPAFEPLLENAAFQALVSPERTAELRAP